MDRSLIGKLKTLGNVTPPLRMAPGLAVARLKEIEDGRRGVAGSVRSRILGLSIQ